MNDSATMKRKPAIAPAAPQVLTIVLRDVGGAQPADVRLRQWLKLGLRVRVQVSLHHRGRPRGVARGRGACVPRKIFRK